MWLRFLTIEVNAKRRNSQVCRLDKNLSIPQLCKHYKTFGGFYFQHYRRRCEDDYDIYKANLKLAWLSN
ncbi:uncharacterized protein Dsimw501_GD27462 [Drosophila simulans]|uniref:Uncharacterized protein n=1 Tax=Drosophila simulans TaxID=7240 RepID=A0A0J9S0H2_DROSI|nr:uncharacterized protein Dsimw501_GD27462 [Drosophila simulans]